MKGEPLHAHSVAEVSFYLMATPCAECGQGPLEADLPARAAGGGAAVEEVAATCRACEHQQIIRFAVTAGDEAEQGDDSHPLINPTSTPSEILDVAQWIMLFRVILETASKETDKVEARRLGFEAAQCLEEALKFYGDDNDLPPATALFHETSRARLRENPGQFSKQRLRDMRAKLPARVTMQKQVARDAHAVQRPWWKLW
ncbi:MAG: hypothetical protein IID39_02400 [Planctomycetes bacterium]|nr:hypothetical protein [Planctomycetota bacterium]